MAVVLRNLLKQLQRSNWSDNASSLSKSSSSCGSSCTSSNTRLLDSCADCTGEAGLSEVVAGVDSNDEVELEHRKWPRVEKVGVTGDGASDEHESREYDRYGASSPASLCASSLFLLSSTSKGNRNGLNLGDMFIPRRSIDHVNAH